MKKFFCNSTGKFMPVFFWATLFLLAILIMVILRFFEKGNFSDGLILGMSGFVIAWIGLYNYQKNGK